MMSAFKGKLFSGQNQALSIALIYFLTSAGWVYVSNYLLFGVYPHVGIEILARHEAISEAVIVLATAVALYLLVGRSISRVQQSERALKDQAERLHVLSHKLLEIQENERRAVAQELHDEIGQALTGLKLSLEMAGRLPQEPARESVHGALNLANDLISRVRKLSLDLRPAALDDLGLLPALLLHFERYTKQTGVQVDFKHHGLEGCRFERNMETVACRIIQEALTNVARHAHTRLVQVRVWVDDVTLNLHVDDHGIGFDAQALQGANSSGLLGMEERASILGGSLTIDTEPGRGTRVAAELPLSLGANNRQERESA